MRFICHSAHVFVCHDTHMHYNQGYFGLNIGRAGSVSYDNMFGEGSFGMDLG